MRILVVGDVWCSIRAQCSHHFGADCIGKFGSKSNRPTEEWGREQCNWESNCPLQSAQVEPDHVALPLASISQGRSTTALRSRFVCHSCHIEVDSTIQINFKYTSSLLLSWFHNNAWLSLPPTGMGTSADPQQVNFTNEGGNVAIQAGQYIVHGDNIVQ